MRDMPGLAARYARTGRAICPDWPRDMREPTTELRPTVRAVTTYRAGGHDIPRVQSRHTVRPVGSGGVGLLCRRVLIAVAAVAAISAVLVEVAQGEQHDVGPLGQEGGRLGGHDRVAQQRDGVLQ